MSLLGLLRRWVIGFARGLVYRAALFFYYLIIILLGHGGDIIWLVMYPMLALGVVLVIEVVINIVYARRHPSQLTASQRSVYIQPIEHWVWIVLVIAVLAAIFMVWSANSCSNRGYDSILACWHH